jgi:hypothetical protein
MRRGVIPISADSGPVAVVGFGMALISTFVAFSGLALPLPEVVYRAAADLGAIVEAADPFGDGNELRTTPLTGGVVLTPAERAALRAARPRAAAPIPVEPQAATVRKPARHKRKTFRSDAHASSPGQRSAPVSGIRPPDTPAAPIVSTVGGKTKAATVVETNHATVVETTKKKQKQARAKAKPKADSSRGGAAGGVPPTEISTPSAAAPSVPKPVATPQPVEPASPAETPVLTEGTQDEGGCGPPNSNGQGNAIGRCK